MKDAWRYWGYLALAVLVLVLINGSATPEVVLFLAGATTMYFLFQAPVWCGAITRDGTLCRRNAGGLLLGCSYRQHKWQKLKMAVVPHGWRRLNQGLWTNPQSGIATVSTMVGIVGGLLGVWTTIFKVDQSGGIRLVGLRAR
jgi:hypothetical protein